MKVTGKNSISNIIKISLQIILIIGIIIIIFLPFLLKQYSENINHIELYFPTIILLYVSGIPALFLINIFIKMFETLKENNPFTRNNVKYLKQSSICSIIIAIEYIVGIFITKSIFATVIIGVFIIASLGLYILSKLLEQAIQYKEENELTI